MENGVFFIYIFYSSPTINFQINEEKGPHWHVIYLKWATDAMGLEVVVVMVMCACDLIAEWCWMMVAAAIMV